MENRDLPICTTKQYAWTLHSQGGNPHTVICVQNLSTQALIGGALWGTHEGVRRNQVQPILLSARISLIKPFTSAAEYDEVNFSTVNYSTLSKAILKIIESRRPDVPHSDNFKGLSMDCSLSDLIEWIEIYLTGKLPPGRKDAVPEWKRGIEGGIPSLEEERSKSYEPPLLDVQNLLELGFKILLPKATLLSEGVSLITSTSFVNDKAVQQPGKFSSVLKIHNIRIPTLIGVNAKERLAKQLVIVNVEIDPYVCKGCDWYNELEQIVVKVEAPHMKHRKLELTTEQTIEESSFETLESLAILICCRVIKYFIYAYTPFLDDGFEMTMKDVTYSQVHISLEKPCAVIFADAPSIEVTRTADPFRDNDSKRLYNEWEQSVKRMGLAKARIPFPLQGSLSSWIACQETLQNAN